MSQPEVVIVGSFVQDHAWLTDRFPPLAQIPGEEPEFEE